MAQVTFDQVKNNFASATNCMRNIQVSDDDGTEFLDLSDYDVVVRFASQIQVAIHGHDLDKTKAADTTEYLSQIIDARNVLAQLRALRTTETYVLSNNIEGFNVNFESRLIDIMNSIHKLEAIVKGNERAVEVSVEQAIIHVNAAHAMPPSGRLSRNKITDFDSWISTGMQK